MWGRKFHKPLFISIPKFSHQDFNGKWGRKSTFSPGNTSTHGGKLPASDLLVISEGRPLKFWGHQLYDMLCNNAPSLNHLFSSCWVLLFRKKCWKHFQLPLITFLPFCFFKAFFKHIFQEDVAKKNTQHPGIQQKKQQNVTSPHVFITHPNLSSSQEVFLDVPTWHRKSPRLLGHPNMRSLDLQLHLQGGWIW